MAHTRLIPQRRCQSCGGKATVEVYNTYNAPCGYFCARHGKQRADEMTRDERKYNSTREVLGDT